jgi:hypothetical protein
MDEQKPQNKPPMGKFSLRIVPNKETKTFSVRFEAPDITDRKFAVHLAEHLADGLDAFLQCVGAAGKLYSEAVDPATGKVERLSERDFNHTENNTENNLKLTKEYIIALLQNLVSGNTSVN